MAFVGLFTIVMVVACISPSCQAFPFFRPNIDYNKKYVPEAPEIPQDYNLQMFPEAKHMITILENRIKEIYKVKNTPESLIADPCRRIKRSARDKLDDEATNAFVGWLVKRCTEHNKTYEDLVRLG